MLLQIYKFKEGDVVYDITRPQQLMLVTKRNGIIYYCKPYKETGNALVYKERDLRGELSDQVSLFT